MTDGKGPSTDDDAEPLKNDDDNNSPLLARIVAVPQGRHRLSDRRASENFEFEVAGLRYTCTLSRFPDGSIGELFLSNHKSNSQADTNARDSAIVFSFAVQHGADPEAIRRALSRDSEGRATGPLGMALDIIAKESGR